ncbi:MAG: hypothetical protein JRJ86_09230 [Deltaproteobacteria bacterium]|nr:hypothetical protein [Deltaproteobacteria bacterium]
MEKGAVREYWRTHSVADEWDKMAGGDIVFERPKKIGISLHTSPEFIKIGIHVSDTFV